MLVKSLKYKYRDTYLYRHAEDKVNKPIWYIYLLAFDDAMNARIAKNVISKIAHRKGFIAMETRDRGRMSYGQPRKVG